MGCTRKGSCLEVDKDVRGEVMMMLNKKMSLMTLIGLLKKMMDLDYDLII